MYDPTHAYLSFDFVFSGSVILRKSTTNNEVNVSDHFLPKNVTKPSRPRAKTAHAPFPQCSGDMSSML